MSADFLELNLSSFITALPPSATTVILCRPAERKQFLNKKCSRNVWLILSKQVVEVPPTPSSVKLMKIVAASIPNTTQRFQAIKVEKETKRIILMNYGAVPVDGGMAVP